MPRLEIIKDTPGTKVVWCSEEMDMTRAKAVLGSNACLAGICPLRYCALARPQEVKVHCRRQIMTCVPADGRILTATAGMNQANPDNLRTMQRPSNDTACMSSPWLPCLSKGGYDHEMRLVRQDDTLTALGLGTEALSVLPPGMFPISVPWSWPRPRRLARPKCSAASDWPGSGLDRTTPDHIILGGHSV